MLSHINEFADTSIFDTFNWFGDMHEQGTVLITKIY